MKKLRNKTFYTIFSLLTIFLIIVLELYNIQNYKREYNGIKENLFRMNNMIDIEKNPREKGKINNSINDKLIIDYEVYTVLLNNNNEVIKIINHSSENSNFNINEITKKILSLNTKDNIKINNLYLRGYSYNFKYNNSLTVINTTNISKRLQEILITSIIVFIIFEILALYFSKIITKWLIKPAEESFNKQKNFIADASHELKTPLAVIMASADALEEEPNEKKWLNNIKDESEKMNTLITSLLDLSKLENGINKSTYKIENLSKIVEKETLIFEGLAYENGITIKTNIDANIMFKCSKEEMNDLISILIDNAIKHSKYQKIININLLNKNNDIILEIINNGDPIPKEEEEKIFERFYRLDKSRNRKEERYGLGLAIAKTIVLNHNGKIGAKSENGKTIFKVIFKNKEH